VTDAELEAVHQTMWRLERRWDPLPIPNAHVHHAYDPLPLALFLPGIRRASEFTSGRRFLDVGCGIGSKLVLMHYLGWETAGIDRHEPYLDAARELVPEADLTLADAFDLDSFETDVLYMYRPMVSDADEDRLEAHVLSRLRPGTVCFLPVRRDPEVWVV
jgi:SAM-dependent methyltransferase